MFFREDRSFRLIEWLETVIAFGAEKVFMFVYKVHPNVWKALQYYVEIGQLEISLITLPGNQINSDPENKGFYESGLKITSVVINEVVLHNDCLHKNAKRYEYLAVIDIDEIIVPRKASTWQEMMEHSPKGYASYSFRHSYFLDGSQDRTGADEAPPYFHMMNSMMRNTHHGSTSAMG